MELAKIESLLDSYFEGETSLDQENMLRDYFSSATIAPHLMAYQGLFVGLKNAQKEVSEREISLPQASINSRRWWLSIAASVVIILGVVGLQFSGNQMTSEEQRALAEFNKTRETLLLMSKSFNKGTQGLAVIDQFTETTNRILK
ncbi:MAG: hypothetical protein ACI93N_002052 [Flavobacteriaceae bacterium]|jgi:hypothetical protein